MSALMDIAELRSRGSDEARGAVGGRPASTTLTLGSDWAELPAAIELAALLPRVPVAGVRLAEPVDLSALPGHVIVRIIALLRECSSIGAQVTWSLTLAPEQLDLIPRLDHLPAPERITVLGQGTPSVDEWRSASNFGLLYFRKGPKFLSVVDQRPESSGEIIVDDPTVIDVLLQGLEGCTWADMTRNPGHAAAARYLVDKGLVMRVGDHCVTLPVHMRSWPLGAALLGGTLAAAGKKRDDAE
ncbi:MULTISPECIES: DUF5825 family protein [unclassified Streptomyces]|uniref:DUF5825 family protein n=1 Tax=unclassified Streptomyces TaxID=2593676 RepID=UPI001BE5E1D3|nr:MULTISPECIES: DUF5825 family protein [unclassified Streptomyces]MBT2407839.1 hypothetical protein [Streptomyces sp. ISL-21]MBT2457357.1 hypothetical protein [Streptomyces sp. ISL-86]MBT2608471.1 hypothetical protein [Streptomyces sp. ISL-87]